jgi:signal transduction histidine kinase
MSSMSPMSPQPRRPAAGEAELSRPAHPLASSPARPIFPGGDFDAASEQGPSVSDFFAQALDGALALVRADGGEIATLDDTRQVLVLRARSTRPRIDPALGPIGAPGRQSQPRPTTLPGAPVPSYPSHPGAGAHELAGVSDEVTGLDAIDIQSTVLLPATLVSRTYRKGERLIGTTWQRGEPVVMNGDQCRSLPAGSAPPDPDAPFHLAVPILGPSSLATTRPNSTVIGVISLFNRDPLWSFTARDVELLTLHADRVARAMRVADLSRQVQIQADLLNVLGSDVSGAALYPRLRDVVRRMIDAPSFAVLLYDAHRDAVTFEVAERDGQPAPASVFPASTLPPWWAPVRRGQTLWISAPEDRAAHPEYCVLGWGGDTPVQSILAAPLHFGSTLVGAIVAGSPRPDVYAPEHARLFTTIARSAAIVIQNARLAHETRASLAKTHAKEQQLSILNNAVLTLNASLDLGETLQALVKQAALLTQDKHCIVFLRDEPSKSLVGRATNIVYESGRTPLEQVHVPLDWRNLGTILESAPFALFDDLDSEWDDTEIGRLLKEDHVRTALVLPIEHKNGPLGALVVHTPAQRHHFTAEEIGLLQGLVSQAGGAINNAMLYREQQETNAQLQAALEKQKELDRYKEDFLLQVSHEFRTPVTTIDGYVTLIEKHGLKVEQAKLNQFANEIRESTKTLMDMVTRLQDANTLDSQPLQLSPRPHHLRATAEKAVGRLKLDDKMRVMLEVPDDLWTLADGDKLTTVFANLIGNAVKYSHKDTSVQVSAWTETRQALASAGRPHAQQAAGAPERWVVAGVRDRGDGIAPEDQAKVFHKFVRLPRSLTTSVRGTGLGLWICRQYLEAMGGDIWVESELGKGSHFQFSLPAADAQPGTKT